MEDKKILKNLKEDWASRLVMRPTITRERHKDGKVCLILSYDSFDPHTGVVNRVATKLWQRNWFIGNELADMPMLIDDALVRIGNWEGKEGRKWIAVKCGDKIFAPSGDKIEFEEPEEEEEAE